MTAIILISAISGSIPGNITLGIEFRGTVNG